jgi:hypothetical protein
MFWTIPCGAHPEFLHFRIRGAPLNLSSYFQNSSFSANWSTREVVAVFVMAPADSL